MSTYLGLNPREYYGLSLEDKGAARALTGYNMYLKRFDDNLPARLNDTMIVISRVP